MKQSSLYRRCIAIGAALVSILAIAGCASRAFGAENTPEMREFSQFAMLLPSGWDGDEQTGFISDDPGEYQITLGRKDDNGDNFLAQVSIFLLPNKPGINSRQAVEKLREAQGDATEAREEDGFMVFEGEPRSRTLKGRARTMVRATPENLLIIMAQDPQNLGSDEIMRSLHGISPTARQLLGR